MSSKELILEFYIERFTKIALPYILYALFYKVIFDAFGINKDFNFTVRYLIRYLKEILYGNVYYHFWFMYSLFGIYLIFPFLKKMLDSLSNKMLCSLLILLVTMQAVQIYFPLLSINIAISDYIFNNWTIYVMFGFVMSKDWFLDKYGKFIVLLGGVAIIILYVMKCYFPDKMSYACYDLSPIMIAAVSGFFVFFLLNEGKITKSKTLNLFIKKISKYSFSIYMIHAYILQKMVILLRLKSFNFLNVFMVIILTFTVSYVFSIIYDTYIVNPIQSCAKFFIGLLYRRS